MSTAILCHHNQFGYCKFKGRCHYQHISTICENDKCEIVSCQNRHPKLCSYFSDFGRYKLVPCAYRHVRVTDNSSEIIEDLKPHLSSNKVEVVKINTMFEELSD